MTKTIRLYTTPYLKPNCEEFDFIEKHGSVLDESRAVDPNCFAMVHKKSVYFKDEKRETEYTLRYGRRWNLFTLST